MGRTGLEEPVLGSYSLPAPPVSRRRGPHDQTEHGTRNTFHLEVPR
jgi:hypothetical protein